jgi:hypothetical protein
MISRLFLASKLRSTTSHVLIRFHVHNVHVPLSNWTLDITISSLLLCLSNSNPLLGREVLAKFRECVGSTYKPKDLEIIPGLQATIYN